MTPEQIPTGLGRSSRPWTAATANLPGVDGLAGDLPSNRLEAGDSACWSSMLAVLPVAFTFVVCLRSRLKPMARPNAPGFRASSGC